MAHCTNCGAEIKPGNTFCTNCGASLSHAQYAPPVAGAVPAPKRNRKLKFAAAVIAILVLLTLVPVVPVPKTHILDFSIPSSGTLGPNAYAFGTVSHIGGTDVLASWSSSTDLTGSIFTADQFTNFKNIISNSPSGQANPLAVETTTHGNLFLRELPYSQVLYFVLWNRHNTSATYYGVDAFTIWTEGECYFTVVNYLSQSHGCFA